MSQEFDENKANVNSTMKDNSLLDELPYLALTYPILSNYKNYDKMQTAVQCFSPEVDFFLYNASTDLPAHNILDFICCSIFGAKFLGFISKGALKYYMKFNKNYNLKELNALNTILSLQDKVTIHGKLSEITISNMKIESYGRNYYLDKPIGMNYDSIKKLLKNMQLDVNKDVRLMSNEDGKHYLCVLTKEYPKFLYPDLEKIKNNYKRLEFPMGENIFDKVSIIDCSGETKHTLIAGGTGGGKSVIDSVIICVCILHELPFFPLDLKNGVEFSQYRASRFCKGFCTDPVTGIFVLMHIYSIVEARNKYFETKGVSSYDEYMKLAEKNNWELIDPIIVVVDEWTTFLELGNGIAKQILSYILNKARSCNIIIFTSLQFASKTNLSQAVKINFGNRIAVKCNDAESAEAVIDKNHIEAYTELYGNKVKGKQKGLCYVKTPTIYEETKIYYFTDKLKKKIVNESKDFNYLARDEKYIQYATNWYNVNIEPKLIKKNEKFDMSKLVIPTDIHGNILNIDDIRPPKSKVVKTYVHEKNKSQIFTNSELKHEDFSKSIEPEQIQGTVKSDVKTLLDSPILTSEGDQQHFVSPVKTQLFLNEETSKTISTPPKIPITDTTKSDFFTPKGGPSNFNLSSLNQQKSKGR